MTHSLLSPVDRLSVRAFAVVIGAERRLHRERVNYRGISAIRLLHKASSVTMRTYAFREDYSDL